jgi:hypothetical protein
MVIDSQPTRFGGVGRRWARRSDPARAWTSRARFCRASTLVEHKTVSPGKTGDAEIRAGARRRASCRRRGRGRFRRVRAPAVLGRFTILTPGAHRRLQPPRRSRRSPRLDAGRPVRDGRRADPERGWLYEAAAPPTTRARVYAPFEPRVGRRCSAHRRRSCGRPRRSAAPTSGSVAARPACARSSSRHCLAERLAAASASVCAARCMRSSACALPAGRSLGLRRGA